MKKIMVGLLRVGLAFVLACVVSVAVTAIWIVLGWVSVCIVVLVTIGAGIAMWKLFRSKGVEA